MKFATALLMTIGVASAARLDHNYLPPGSAATAGGANFIQAPAFTKYNSGSVSSGSYHAVSSGSSSGGSFNRGQSGAYKGQSGAFQGQTTSFQSQSAGSQGQSGSYQGQSGAYQGVTGSSQGQSGAYQGVTGSSQGQSGAYHGSGSSQGQSGAYHGSGSSQGQSGAYQGVIGSSQGQSGAYHGSGSSQGQSGAYQGVTGSSQGYSGAYQGSGSYQSQAGYRGQQYAITQYNNQNNGDGSYQYNYETENGIAAQEAGALQGDAQTVSGSYSYTGSDGVVYTIRYIAGPDGFQAEGDHLPTPPPISEEIRRGVELSLAAEARGENQDGQYHPEPQQVYNKYQSGVVGYSNSGSSAVNKAGYQY